MAHVRWKYYAKKNYRVTWQLKYDSFSVLFKLRECVDSNHPVNFVSVIDNRVQFLQSSYHYTYLNMYSKGLAVQAEELLGVQCQEKTFKLVYPCVHSDLDPSFIRGVFEGDGSLGFDIGNATVRFEIASANYQFLCDIQAVINRECLSTLEKRGSIRICNNVNILRYNTWKEILQICEWMYDNKSCMFYERKYNRYQKCKEMFGDGIRAKINKTDRRYHIQQYKQTEDKLCLEILENLKQWKQDPFKQKELNIRFSDNFTVIKRS